MKIAFLIKTFMREASLIRLVDSIKANFDNYRIYIADDSEITQSKLNFYDEITAQGHKVIFLPFDSGLSAGRNALMRSCKEKYYVLCDDDYLFTSNNGVLEAINKLDKADIITGTLLIDKAKAGAEYELTISNGILHKKPIKGNSFRAVDMGLNFFVGEKRYYWDENIKIGEEHMDFFLARKKEGVRVYHDPKLIAIHDVRTEVIEYKKYRERRNKNYLKEKWNIYKIKEGELEEIL